MDSISSHLSGVLSLDLARAKTPFEPKKINTGRQENWISTVLGSISVHAAQVANAASARDSTAKVTAGSANDAAQPSD